MINKRRLTEDDFCTTGTQNKSKQTNETPKRLEKRTREMDPHLLFVIFIPLPLVLADTASDIKSTYWYRNVSANNLVFADHLLWSMTSRSTVECAEICSEDVNCTSFTYTDETSDALRCRGHSQQMTSGGTITAGTKLYNLAQPDGGIIDLLSQTPSTGLRHPSFGGRCRKAML